MRQTSSLVEGVVSAVVGRKGVETSEIDPLFNVIEPDALNTLFRDGTDARVIFEFEGCKVTVSATGHIDVEQLD